MNTDYNKYKDAVNKEKGKEAENAALEYLTAKGYTLLARNWRSSYSEVDLVMRDGETLVFVEVKGRSAGNFDSPDEQITRNKGFALHRARDAWWDEHGKTSDFRIDLVVVLWGNPPKILLFKEMDVEGED